MRIKLINENEISKIKSIGTDGYTFMIIISENKSIYPIELAPLDISLDSSFQPVTIHDAGLTKYWDHSNLELPNTDVLKANIAFDSDDVLSFPENELSVSKDKTIYDPKNHILYYKLVDELAVNRHIQFTDHTIFGVDAENKVVEMWVFDVPKI